MRTDRQLPRKLAAILYGDVTGYSRLTAEDEDATHRRLSDYLDLFAATVKRHRGQVMHYAGDAVLAKFDAVVDALTCAAEVQRDLASRNADLPPTRRVEFGIGINLGDVIEDRGDIYGDGVNVAARLEGLAGAGEICVSESVRISVGQRLPLSFEDLGEQTLKNIDHPVRTYRVSIATDAMLEWPTYGADDASTGGRAPGKGLRSAIGFSALAALLVALAVSAYLNVGRDGELATAAEPVSVLIADFENRTGEAIFDGVLEQALNIGIEGAPNITSFARNDARELAARLQPGTAGLSAPAARLVAVREGVKLVLSGAVERLGEGFRFELAGLDPIGGETKFAVSAQAPDRDAVLTAVGSLSRAIRQELGDPTLRFVEAATAETFTAASLEAASAYMQAIELAYAGRHEEAIEKFGIATELDGGFGRAFAGWAVSEFKLGRAAEATKLWSKALSLMSTMTERERLRTLGLYYVGVTRNYEQAVETFAELVAKYPADAAARNNLAVAAFLTLDFETAFAEGRGVLDIYPHSRLYRANLALYAMYAGDFATAADEARAVIEQDPAYGSPYLPLAIAQLATGDQAGAGDAYRRMAVATSSEHRESMATLGLADVAIYAGDVEQARRLLTDGIERDVAAAATAAAGTKQIALAEALAVRGEPDLAADAARQALELSRQDSIKVAAAMILAESGDREAAARLADELGATLNTQNRAYSLMIQGAIQRHSADANAIHTLRSAIAVADLWRIRYELGRAYLDTGYFAEAFGELEKCLERRGEATAMFFDDAPTFRILADLRYWLARAQQGLGMTSAAAESYRAFLALRPQGGSLADDARQRLP